MSGAGAQAVGRGIVAGLGEGGEEVRFDPAGGAGPLERRIGVDGGLGAMAQALAEFMRAADMIEVGVGGDQGHRPPRKEGDVLQRPQPHAGIDEQVAVTPAHVPHVGAEKGADVRLADQRHAVLQGFDLVPGVGDRQAHAAGASVKSRPNSGCGSVTPARRNECQAMA